MSATQPVHSSSDSTSNPPRDVFSLLSFLFHTQHTQSGSRDYLIHQLYDLHSADIDFVLPQLLALLLSWDRTKAYRLSEFILGQCSSSIHLSLKTIWICEAQEYYSKSAAERDRIRDFIHSVEMSLVNSDIFGLGEHNVDGCSDDNNSAAKLKARKKKLRIINNEHYAQHKLHSPKSRNSSHHASYNHSSILASPKSPECLVDTDRHGEGFTATIYSPLSQSTDLGHSSKHSHTRHESFAFTVTDIDGSLHGSESLAMPVSTEEIFMALSKQVKCDYFQRELKLIISLIDISNQLVKFSRPDRKPHLRKMLNQLPRETYHGLYFPSNEPHQRHYKILSLLPGESIPLNSRDKAPFLLYFEIQHSGYDTHSYDIFNAYKARETIMDEAIEIEERCGGTRQAVDESDRGGGVSVNDSKDADSIADFINEKLLETQESGMTELFHEMDRDRKRRTSLAGVLESALKSSSHPAAELADVAVAEQNEKSDNSGTVAMQSAEGIVGSMIVSPSSALTETEPVSPSLLLASQPRSGHASALSSLIDDEEVSFLKESSIDNGNDSDSATPAMSPRPHPMSITLNGDQLPAHLSVVERADSDLTINVSALSVPLVRSPLKQNSSSLNLAAQNTGHDTTDNDGDNPLLHTGGSRGTLRKLSHPSPTNAHSNSASSNNHGKRQQSSLKSSPSLNHLPESRHDTLLSAIRCDPSYQRDKKWLLLDSAFGDQWHARKQRIASQSPHSQLPGYDLHAVIFKNGDDCRQEVLAMQLIRYFAHIWTVKKLPLYLKPYSVLITSPQSGLIEVIHDATSIDSLKKSARAIDSGATLASFFHEYFALQGASRHRRAIFNYCESLAAYSIVTYLLAIKDRHNGNIMLTRDGHLIHIDFGFMLSNSPGRNINFESAPFKLTREYIAIMGDESETSSYFNYYRRLFVQGFLEARKHSNGIMLLIQFMMKGAKMPCFAGAGETGTLLQLRQRLRVDVSDREAIVFAHSLIDRSIDNWRTVKYDAFQYYQNNII